jgi:hypothetical protein
MFRNLIREEFQKDELLGMREVFTSIFACGQGEMPIFLHRLDVNAARVFASVCRECCQGFCIGVQTGTKSFVGSFGPLSDSSSFGYAKLTNAPMVGIIARLLVLKSVDGAWPE